MLLKNAGLGWASIHHRNKHGNHNITWVHDITRYISAKIIPVVFSKINLDKVFNGVPSDVLEGLLRKYEMDFRICGYSETLAEFKALIDGQQGL